MQWFLLAYLKPCTRFCRQRAWTLPRIFWLILNHATNPFPLPSHTCSFWLTTNLHCKLVSGWPPTYTYKVVLRLPQTSWGYTMYLTRLTTQLHVHKILQTFEWPLENIIELLSNTCMWHIIHHAHESIPQNHTNFELVVHHHLIFNVVVAQNRYLLYFNLIIHHKVSLVSSFFWFNWGLGFTYDLLE